MYVGHIAQVRPLRVLGRAKRWTPGCTACRAAIQYAEPRETLQGKQLDDWQACVDRVCEIGFNEADAEIIVEKSFGWKGQAFWRQQKVEEVPSLTQVQAVLDFLETQGIKPSDLPAYIKKFPQVFGCDVKAQLSGNVTILEDTWKLRGAVLTNVLKRRPEILGYNVDCEGSCVGECNRCWVRF